MASSQKNLDWLIEWVWDGTTYRYSMYDDRSHGGNAYSCRILELSGLASMYIDRTNNNVPSMEVTLDNLADDGTTTFPFQALNATDDFEDKILRVYLYDWVADTKQLVWQGYTKRPEFDPVEHTVTISGSHPLDAIELQVPALTLSHSCPYHFGGSDYETRTGAVPSVGCPYNPGGGIGVGAFTSCNKQYVQCEERGMLNWFGGVTRIAPVLNDQPNNLVEREKIRSSGVPIVYGSGDIRVRCEVYHARLVESELLCNFILSSTHVGLPFDSAQLDETRVKLGTAQRAKTVEFKTGIANQPIPGNRTKFPAREGHSYWAYGCAVFDLTQEQKDKFGDEVPFHIVSAKPDGGRKLLRSGGISENPVYILEDICRDELNGLALPAALIDSASVVSAASYIGTRFRARVELDKPENFIDLLQNFLGSYHGYISWDTGVMVFGAKRDDEDTMVAATFGSGGGIDILDHDQVIWTELDYSELLNEVSFKWRSKVRKKREIVFADRGAQIKAGNGLVKRVTDEWFIQGIYDDEEAAISAAIFMREEQNLDAMIEFKVHLNDWMGAGVSTGNVIRVNSHHITNNGSNYLFRVEYWEIDAKTFEVTIKARIYKPDVYAYNSEPIGVDLLRTGDDTSVSARPPDVSGCTAVITDVFTDDDDERIAAIQCDWTYPDLTAQMAEDEAEGVFPEYPIEAVRLYWQYTDENANDLNLGPRITYPTTGGVLQVPFHKDRQVVVWFVALGKNNAQGKVGRVIDPAQSTFLDEDVDTTEFAIDVDDGSVFTAGDYVRCEAELMQVASVAGNTITLEDTAGVRDSLFDTDASSHPDGTEIGVAVTSHPTVTVDMTARRHSLPQVTGVVSRSRPRGVRVKWTNLPDYDNEKYFLYWSVTGALDDADAWVASWSAQDPKTPTAGINLVKCGKKAHHLIPQEDIDTAYGGDASGVDVQIRVTAKIKNNYSSALSALPGDIPGHHNRPWAAPAAPITPEDITQEVTETSDRVRVRFRVYATEDRTTGTPRTFEEVNTHIIGLVLEKYSKALADWSGDFIPLSEEVEDPTASYQDLERTFHKGSRWRIRRAFARNPGTKRVSSALDLDEDFRVGGQSDVLSGITDLAIAPFGSNENTDSIELDGNDSQLLVTWTQPATPIALRELQIRKKKSTVTKWRRVPAVQLLDRVDDNGNPFNDAVVPAKAVRVDVHHPRGVNMDFEVRLVGADGDTSSWEGVNATTTDDAGGDLPIRSDANGPSYPSGPGNANIDTTGTAAALHRNHVVADGAKLQVEAAFQLLMDGTAQDQNFGTPDATYGPVRDAVIVLQKRNAANSANEGDPLRIKVGIDPTKGLAGAEFYAAARLEAGAIYDWPETIYYNSSDELSRASTPADTRFRAGRGSHQFNATSIVTATLTRTDSTNNRNAVLDLAITQPSTPVLLKRVVIEVTYNLSAGLAATWKKVKSENLLDDFAYVSATGGVVRTLTFQVQHKKNQNDMGFRAILVPVNSDYGTTGTASPNKVVTTGTLTATEDAEFNSVAPPGGSITTPTIKWTRKGLRLRVGPLNAATDGFMGITKYGWVLRANDDSTYVTIEGASSATRAGAEFFTTNSHTTLVLRRRDLASALRTTGLKVYVRVFAMVAGVETSSISGVTVGAGGDAQAGYSAASSGTGALESDAYNDDDGINTRRAFREGGNNIEGGGFYNGRGTGQYAAGGGDNTQAGQQWRVAKAGSAVNSEQAYNPSNIIGTTTLFGVTWNQASHRLQIATTNTRIYGKLGRNIHGGRWFSFGALFGKFSGTVDLTSVRMRIVEVKDGAAGTGTGGALFVITNASATWTHAGLSLGDITAANPYTFIGGNCSPIASFVQNANSKMWLEITPQWTGGGVLAMDDVGFYNGKDVRPWTPGFIESGLETVVDLSVASSAYAATYVDYGGLNDGNADSTMAIYDFT